MTDPNPLLYRTRSPEPDHPPPPKKIRPSLDDTIEQCIGNIGWPQIFQATLVSFAWFFDAQQTFISVFTDAEPKWSCTHNNSTSCTSTTNPCQLPDNSWSWDSPSSTSIISEWSLQCAGSVITGLPASVFLFGCLIGGFALATLADSSMGRKNLLVFSSLIMSTTGVLTAFSPDFWIYVGLRFVSGFGRATIGTCALVLSTYHRFLFERLFMETDIYMDLCSFPFLLFISFFPCPRVAEMAFHQGTERGICRYVEKHSRADESGRADTEFLRAVYRLGREVFGGNRYFIGGEDLGGERVGIAAASGGEGCRIWDRNDLLRDAVRIGQLID
ncbi:Organic cation/carnitine transporter 3 [Castilleja foliolosa]|uniref:Organic cation/carnitine transporter 3 n=1 Tax=Castilleja foliolosa TaxID=1961234 RepID=A0ABD3EC98_9LAMI